MVSSQIAPAGLFSSNRSSRSLDSTQSLLSSLGQTQNSQSIPGFGDLLTYFLKLEEMARKLARQQAVQADLAAQIAGTGLQSAGLHLDIRIEGFTNLSAADAGGTLAVDEHTYSSAEGFATRVTLRTPQIQADGSVSYNVTVLKLAVSVDGLEPRPALAQAMALGQPQIGAASGAAAGQSLADFMAESGSAGGSGTLIWQFSSDHVAFNEDFAAQRKLVNDLYAMANALMEYLNQQQIIHAFDMSAEEKKRLEELIKQQQIAAEKAAVLEDIKKKRIALEMVTKDTLKRLKIQQEVEQQASAKSLHHRLAHFLGSTEKQLEQASVDPVEFAGLLEDFHRLSLEMKAALAAQTAVSTSSSH